MPFYLRTGKRMPERKSEDADPVQARAAQSIFAARRCGPKLDANVMIINLQPEENIRLSR